MWTGCEVSAGGGGCIEIDGNRSVDRSLRMEMGDGGADWRTDRYIDMKMDMYEQRKNDKGRYRVREEQFIKFMSLLKSKITTI